MTTKNNEKFLQEILDDVNEVLETMQTTPENAEDESDHTIAEAHTPFQNQQKTMSIFVGLRICTKKSLK